MERKRSFPAVVRQQTREEDLDSATEGLGPLAQFERHACTVSGLPHSEGASSSASVFTRERAGARTVQASVSSAVPHKDAAREDPGSDWSGRQVQATIVESAESHEGERPMQDCPRRRGHREESADEDAGAIRVDVAPFREDAENDSMRSTVTPRGISQRGRCDRRATGGDSEDFAPQRFRPSSRCARQRPFVSKDSSEFERRPLTKQGRHTSSSRSMESEAAVILGRAPNSLSISQRVEDASEGWDESSDALRPQRQTGGQSSREGSRASQATKDEAKQVRHSSGSRSSREGSRVSFAKEESKASSQTSGTRQPSRPMQPHGASCGDLAYEGSEVWSDTIGIWKPLLESEQASPAGKSEEQRFSREISLSSKRSSSSRAGEASQCTPAAPAAPAIREDSLPSSNGSASSAEEKEALLSSSGSEMSAEGEENDLNLFDAAEQGNLKVVRRLLESGANINAHDARKGDPYYEGTALIYASRKGDFRVLECLLRARADVHQADKKDYTPLRRASRDGCVEVLERLLQARADANEANYYGTSPLLLASWQGHAQVLQRLLEARANVNQTNRNKYTPLLEASGEGHVQVLELLLEARADVNQAEKKGETPLLMAAARGHSEILDRLLHARADVDQRTKCGSTPLMGALGGCADTKVLERLLHARAAVNKARNHARHHGFTPLLWALQLGRGVQVLECLFKARADVNQARKNGWTPLLEASRRNTEVLKCLLKARADVDQGKKNGLTPLMEASVHGHVENVKCLLKKKAKVNQANMNGWTPLIFATRDACVEVVKCLVANKADVNVAADVNIAASRKHLSMPLHIALEGNHSNHREVANFLARYALCDMRVLKQCLRGGGATRVAVLDELTAHPRQCYAGNDNDSDSSDDLHEGPFESHIASATLLFCPKYVPRKSNLSNPECGILGKRARWFMKARLCDLFKLSVSGDLMNNRETIRMLCKSDDEVLLTDFAEVLLQAAWKRHELSFYLDVVLSAVFVGLFCAATGHTRHGEEVPVWISILLLSLLGKRMFEEAAQFGDMVGREQARCTVTEKFNTTRTKLKSCRTALLEYLFDLDNIVDLIFLITSFCAVTFCFVLRRHYNGPFSKFAIAFVVAQAWIRLLYSLRGFRPVGTRMLPILRAIWHTKIFLVVVLLCLAAGVHAYYTLGLRGDPNPIYASIMQIGNLGVLGDFDLFTFEGEDVIYEEGDNGTWVPKDPTPTDDYLYAHVVFFSVAVLITIFLMNLLIGVLSANYDLYEEVANALFLRSRARFIISFSLRPWSGCIRALKRVLNCVSCGYLDKCTRGLKRSLNCISCGCLDKCITWFRWYFCSQDWSKLWEGRETIDLWFLKPVTPGTEDLRSMRAVLADKLKGQAERIETVQKRLNDQIETVEKRLNAKLEDQHARQHAQLKKIEDLILKMAESGRGGRSSGRSEGSFSRPPRTSRQHSWPSA
eukprot:TRINITY_DN5404_c0_g1_i6.p1 TRINITY_DN5404_c0_g1~~TRINITY_DN5404_c0_g1_i6.p1  ORF type:complete len:1447 (-),score=234.61 TRINITY_DN5404_c0_g1_i6:22-4362(-)